MNIVMIVGWFSIASAVVVTAVGAWAVCGKLAFHARWLWGRTHKIKRSVRLGWNVGMPPEGVLFLSRNNMDDYAPRGTDLRNHGWAVMVRRGEKCFAVNGGLAMPVTYLTGWLEITT